MTCMSSKVVSYRAFISTNMRKTNTMKIHCNNSNIPNQKAERGYCGRGLFRAFITNSESPSKAKPMPISRENSKALLATSAFSSRIEWGRDILGHGSNHHIFVISNDYPNPSSIFIFKSYSIKVNFVAISWRIRPRGTWSGMNMLRPWLGYLVLWQRFMGSLDNQVNSEGLGCGSDFISLEPNCPNYHSKQLYIQFCFHNMKYQLWEV